MDDGFAQIFSQIVSIRVKKLSNTNCIASRHITREKSSLPVDVRCSKTSLLKLPINDDDDDGDDDNDGDDDDDDDDKDDDDDHPPNP